MKVLLLFLMLAMGAVHAADSTNESLASSCWNLKIGAIGAGQVYMLGVIAKHQDEAASEIRHALDQMFLSQKDRENICSIVESSSKAKS